MELKTNYFDLKKQVLEKFEQAGIDEISDFDWICCEITGKRRSELPFVKEFSAEELEKINQAVEKRIKHVPLAYIFGKTNFYGLDFIVSKDVLIPRLDTEILVEKIIEEINSRNLPVSVLDVGTGSGAIAISVCKETGAKTTAVDVSEKALEIARQNAEINHVDINFIKSDLFDNISDLKADILVSNPPYIETEVVKMLDKEVVEHDPNLALDGGSDGLDFYREIASNINNYLLAGGVLLMEIGYNQGALVKKLFEDIAKDIEIIKDYNNNDRIVVVKI